MIAEVGFVIMLQWSWKFDASEIHQTSTHMVYGSKDVCVSARKRNAAQMGIEWEQDIMQGHARFRGTRCERVYEFNRQEVSQ